MGEQISAALLIAVMSLVTIGLRAIPFLIFSQKRKVPQSVLYLGQVLPGAALGMLVIYCLRDLNMGTPGSSMIPLLSCLLVAVVQVLKRNTIYSILAGTAAYMLFSHL